MAIKRIKGVRRIERDRQAGWIARDHDGADYPEPGFRWNTRSGAWHAATEVDMYAEGWGKRP